MAKYYAGLGWGDYIPKRSVKDYKPGDILSSNCSDCGHVWISLGTCEDGSVVVLHSTSNGGVQLSGTVSDEGEYGQLCVPYGEILYGTFLSGMGETLSRWV